MTNLLISHNFKTMKCPVVSGTFRTLAADPLGPVGCGLSGLFCNPWMLMGLGSGEHQYLGSLLCSSRHSYVVFRRFALRPLGSLAWSMKICYLS